MAVTAVEVVAVVNAVAVVMRDVNVVVPLDVDRGVHVARLAVNDNFRSVHEFADNMAGHNLDHSAGLAAVRHHSVRPGLVTLGIRSRFGRGTFGRRSLS